MKTKCFKKVVNSTISSLFAGIVVIMAMFMVVGCEKEESVNKEINSNSESTFLNFEVDADGIIVFKNYEEYYNACNTYMKISKKQIRNLETMKNFHSYDAIKEEAFEKLEELENDYINDSISLDYEYEFSNIMQEYSDYICVKENLDGEKHVESILPPIFDCSLADKHGAFIIGDTIYKIGQNHMFSTTLSNKSLFLNSPVKDDRELLQNPEIENYEFSLSTTNIKNCNENYTSASTTTLGDWWWQARRATIELSTYYRILSTTQLIVKMHVFGQKKNSIGIWIYYTTVLFWQNIAFNLIYTDFSSSNKDTISGSIPNNTVGIEDRYRDWWEVAKNDITNYNSNTFTTNFYTVYGQGKSQGTGSAWATISCQ